jgi:hypothetical protein
MTTAIFWVAVCFASPPAFARWIFRAQPGTTRFYGRWASFGLCAVPGAALGAHDAAGWLNVAAWGASGLTGLVLWWWSRRKRKRSLKLLGSKARARLAAMLRNMPRLSPRLVPQGVPA